MGVRTSVHELLEAIKDRTGSDFTMKGLRRMSDELEKMGVKGLTERSLYNLHKGHSNSRVKLDLLAEVLGFSSFRVFEESLKIDPVLRSLVGEYYCYIRMQMDEGKVLRSPVRISSSDGRISYQLKGGRLEYRGDIKKVDGCLFVLMTSADGTKSFYHVYRIGKMPRPAVLQGIFSGVSTDLNPIGGRAILLRRNESFESLTKKKADLGTLMKSKHPIERRIAKYFKNKHENNITIKRPYTFGPDDL